LAIGVALVGQMEPQERFDAIACRPKTAETIEAARPVGLAAEDPALASRCDC
jgi:hypothetical protein